MSDEQNKQTPPDQNGGSDPDGGGQQPQAPPPVKFSRGILSWVIILSLLIMLFVALSQNRPGKEIETWQEFVKLVDPAAGKVKPNTIVIKESRVEAVIKAGTIGFSEDSQKETLIFTGIDAQHRDETQKKLDAIGVNYSIDTATNVWFQVLMAFGPILLIILIIWIFIARSMRSAGGGPGGMLGSFGKSRHRISSKDTVNVKFDDVAGIEEAKLELTEIVEFLKNPKRFTKLGGRIPRGVLLVGPPGCGKTLLAKAIAGEADVPFFSISGSDFVEMFVGVGASRVRDLFKQAKDNSPCIIFLDEIDAVGRKRGGGFTTGGHDEREQTLNAILVEMDGFDANDQVIVIAATNRADVLDPALTRPGRFDRRVDVMLPDIVGRKEILEVHARKIKLASSVDLERVARGTPMFSGADLAALINEAAIIATMSNKDAVEMPDIEEARDKLKFGRARKNRRIEEQEREATAYHEAGHAAIQMVLEDTDPVHKVTIIPRGQAMGATFSLPEKDRYGFGAKYLNSTMRVLCGGRIAEHRKTDDVSSGAAMDIQMATRYARHMVLEWGMSPKLGFVNYAGEDNESFMPEREYSDETARIIDEEVKRLIDEAYRDAERMIADYWDKVEAIARALLKYETLTHDDVKRLMDGERLDKPTVAELLKKETKASVAPNAGYVKPTDTPELGDDAGGMMPSPA